MRRWSTGDRRRAPRRLSGQPAPAWAASHYLDTRPTGPRELDAVPAPRRPLDDDADQDHPDQDLGPSVDSDGEPTQGTSQDSGQDRDPTADLGPDQTWPLELGVSGRHRAGNAGLSVEALLARARRDTAPSWASVLGSAEARDTRRARPTRVLDRYRPLDDEPLFPPHPPRSAPAVLYPLEVAPPAAGAPRRRERLTSGVLLVVMLLAGTVIGYHVLAPSNVVAALPPADTSPYGATGALPGSLNTPLPDAAAGQAPQEAGLPPVAGLSGIPATVLAAYHSAEAQLAAAAPGCRLSWSLLAGIGKIESDHARGGQVDTTGTTLHPILGPVLDGTNGNAAITDTDDGRLDGDPVHDRAVGPMQFLPGTWATWGVDANSDGRADPNNTADAATAAGRYLCAGGLDASTTAGVHDAVFRYNHSESYVAHVLAWARAYATGTIPTPDDPTGDDPDSTSSAVDPAPAGPEVLAAAATTPSPAHVLAAAAAPHAPAPVAPPPGATLLPILPAPTPPSPAPTATPAAVLPTASSSTRTATATPSSSSTSTTAPSATAPSTTTPARPTTPPNVTTTTTPARPATTSTSPPAPTTTTTTAVPPTTTSGVPVLGAPSPIAVTVPSSTPTSTTTTPSSSSATRTHPAHTSATRTTTPPSSSTSAGDPGSEGSSSEVAGAEAQGGTPVSSGVGGGGSTLDTAVSGIKALLGDVQTEGAPQPTLVSTSSESGLRFALPGGGRRSEVIPPLEEYREGQQMWLHYRAQLTGVPVETNTWQLIAQFHHDGNTGSPPIALEVGHGHLRLANQGAHQQDVGPIAADGIVDVVLHVAFSRDPARGQVDVWRDGIPVLAGYHPPGGTLLDGGDYLKVGLYRDPAIGQASSVTVLEVQAQPTPLPSATGAR